MSKIEEKAESLWYFFRDDREFHIGWKELSEERKNHYRDIAKKQIAEQLAKQIVDLM